MANQNSNRTHKDAIVYPFKRGNLIKIDSLHKNTKKDKEPIDPTWHRVLSCFIQDRSLDDDEILAAENSSKILVDTHPIDQILLLIKHFEHRIPTLSLLTSSWSHYHETYLAEHHNIDLLSARKKHQQLDEQLRSSIKETLDQQIKDLSEDEIHILEILKKHKHPRRQLFWAFQARSKYPKLNAFFDRNMSLMLPVTSSGNILKK